MYCKLRFAFEAPIDNVQMSRRGHSRNEHRHAITPYSDAPKTKCA